MHNSKLLRLTGFLINLHFKKEKIFWSLSFNLFLMILITVFTFAQTITNKTKPKSKQTDKIKSRGHIRPFKQLGTASIYEFILLLCFLFLKEQLCSIWNMLYPLILNWAEITFSTLCLGLISPLPSTFLELIYFLSTFWGLIKSMH